MKKEIQTGSKVNTYNVNDNRFKVILAHLYSFTGLTEANYPDESSTLMLIKHLKDRYGNLTILEIKTAFDLASQGIFDNVDNKSDSIIKHYQTFSPVYLSSVLNPYLEYRKAAIKEINKQRMELEAIPKKMTPEQIAESDRRFDYNFIVPAFYGYFKNGKLDFGTATIAHVYRQLDGRHKLIHESNAQKKERYNKVDKDLPRYLNKKTEDPITKLEFDFKDLAKKVIAGKDNFTKNEIVKEICREQLIMELFEVINKSPKSIEEMLKLTPEWIEKYNNQGKARVSKKL